jgi:hypothetical protein
MNEPDPLEELQQMAITVTQRTPPAFQSADELWHLVRLLELVMRERPDYVASFPAADQELYVAAMRAPLAAFDARGH